MSDITGGKPKTYTICLFETFWSIGVIFLPLLAYLFPNWSDLYLAISLPTIIYIGLWFFITDSPRWLLSHGHIDKARDVLLYAAKMNKNKDIPEDLEQRLKSQAEQSLKAAAPATWWSLWKGPKAKTTMIATHLAWAIYVTNYNGMLVNVKAFGRDYIDVNTIIFGKCFIKEI